MSSSDAAGSIVIPAWNEAPVIGENLLALFDGLVGGGSGPRARPAPDVVVACNGCTDGTADVVRRLRLPIEVIELPGVGKARAIRAAEEVISGLPRLYLDADVRLAGSSALVVLDALRDGAVAARPPVVFDSDRSSRLVRAFYRVRSGLPGVMGDLCGAGVYGLSATARDRFSEFPDVEGDDLFAARIVASDEIVIVECDPVRVRVPVTVRALVRTLGRVYRGNRALAAEYPDAVTSTAPTTCRDLVAHARSPGRWADSVAYAVLVIAGRARSFLPADAWERDESVRTAARAGR